MVDYGTGLNSLHHPTITHMTTLQTKASKSESIRTTFIRVGDWLNNTSVYQILFKSQIQKLRLRGWAQKYIIRWTDGQMGRWQIRSLQKLILNPWNMILS